MRQHSTMMKEISRSINILLRSISFKAISISLLSLSRRLKRKTRLRLTLFIFWAAATWHLKTTKMHWITSNKLPIKTLVKLYTGLP